VLLPNLTGKIDVFLGDVVVMMLVLFHFIFFKFVFDLFSKIFYCWFFKFYWLFSNIRLEGNYLVHKSLSSETKSCCLRNCRLVIFLICESCFFLLNLIILLVKLFNVEKGGLTLWWPACERSRASLGHELAIFVKSRWILSSPSAQKPVFGWYSST
jgi:hypothetical protein